MALPNRADLEQSAKSRGFSTPLAEYPTGSVKLSIFWMICFFVMGIFILVTILGFVAPNPKEKHGALWGLGAVVVGGIFIGYGIFMLRRILNSRMLLLVYPEGLACADKTKTQTCRWDEMTTVTREVLGSTPLAASLFGPPELPFFKQSASVGRDYCCVVQGKAGQRLYLTSLLPNLAELTNQIEAQHCQRLVPPLLQQLQAGGSSIFGPLTVDRSGLRQGKQTLAWGDIEELQVNAKLGRVIVKRRGKRTPWLFLPTVNMPNSAVFLALTNQWRGVKTG